MQLPIFLLGALLLAGLVRLWRGLPWSILGVYLLLVLVFFAPPLFTSRLQVPTDIAYRWLPWSEAAPAGLVPRNDLLSDVPLQMLPFRTLVRERLLGGSLPFWASELGTGQPLAGNAQSAPFAPLHLLALPLPPLRALTVTVAWQVLLALLLTHALAAALGAGTLGSALAALAFAFSPFEISWAYYPLGMTTVFLPGLLLGVLLLRRGERGGLSGTVACGFALLLSGHPETAVQLALVAAVAAAVLLAVRGGISRPRFAAKVALAAVVLGCLAAPALLPALDALPESTRWHALTVPRMPAAQAAVFEPRLAATLVDPLVFGSPRDQNFDGPDNYNEICGAYAGLVALAAAVAGAVVAPRRCLPLLAAGGAALLASLRLAPFSPLLSRLPGLAWAPASRFRIVFVLAVAVAGGLALDHLIASGRGRRLFAAALAAAAGALALLPPPGGAWQRAWWIAALTGAALVAAALLLAPLLGAGRRPLAALLLGALLLDLWLLNTRYNPVVPARFDLAPPAAVQFLAAERRSRSSPVRVMGELDDLKPNLGSLYGLWDPRANDPMAPARASLIAGRAMRRHHRLGEPLYLVLSQARTPLLDYLGVRYLLLRRRAHLAPPWRSLWDEPGQRLWENDRALDLFFMPARVASAATESEVLSRTLLNQDFRELAVLASPVPALPLPARGTLTRIAPRPNGFDLDLATSTGGLVASSVSFSRGWQAEVDGATAPTREVNSGFLAFVVRPGPHHVRLTYRPPHWRLALALAALGSALLAAQLAFGAGSPNLSFRRARSWE